jgi:hypothetical protein
MQFTDGVYQFTGVHRSMCKLTYKMNMQGHQLERTVVLMALSMKSSRILLDGTRSLRALLFGLVDCPA